jgi:hypothetical protein
MTMEGLFRPVALHVLLDQHQHREMPTLLAQNMPHGQSFHLRSFRFRRLHLTIFHEIPAKF